MPYPRLAIIDLETTGADPTRDRITEIAILLTEGDVLLERWSSLVNPGMPIPPRIEQLIGITDAMVADAPDFAALMPAIRRQLEGAIFVAHNVRFDYNFMRAAFEREEQSFHAPTLCSVKFSRALFPQFTRHGLDAIIERRGYRIDARHRALDDAQIVWQFMQDCQQEQSPERIAQAWQRALSTTPQPRMPIGDLEALPECAGVYVLRNSHGHALHIGRSRNLRSEVLGLFSRQSDSRLKSYTRTTHSVDSFPAAGDFEAQLLELRLQRSEAGNKAPPEWAWGWQWQADDTPGAAQLQLRNLSGSDPASWGSDCFGCLRGEQEARKLLRDLCNKHRLCPRRVGLEFGLGACHAHALGKCAGVCGGHESAAQHDARMLAALASMRLRDWPGTGALLIAEHDEAQQRSAFHVFDQWCHLGSSSSLAEAQTLAAAAPPRRFDAALYRLLQRWLTQPGRSFSAL